MFLLWDVSPEIFWGKHFCYLVFSCKITVVSIPTVKLFSSNSLLSYILSLELKLLPLIFSQMYGVSQKMGLAIVNLKMLINEFSNNPISKPSTFFKSAESRLSDGSYKNGKLHFLIGVIFKWMHEVLMDASVHTAWPLKRHTILTFLSII